MKRLNLLTLCTLVVAALIFFFKKRSPTTIAEGNGLVLPKEWLVSNPKPVTPAVDVRPADQTFLTFPEWYLVFSPEEQAHYFQKNTATSFPFMRHTRQIWEGYSIVNDQIKDNFPTNTGYHFMIWVIGSSTTVEYSIKAWYETVVGRLTDTRAVVTEEDQFNARFTQDYVDFIKDRPWYEFDFKTRLKSLWTETPLFGSHWLRKAERRYILTSELIVKYLYGKLIGIGTQQVYDAALPTTAVWMDDSMLVQLPRYDKFNAAITGLALEGHTFQEIAGNNSAILLTVLAPQSSPKQFGAGRTVFVQPIATDAARKRIALAVPVGQLHQLLAELMREHVTIEHVFDY